MLPIVAGLLVLASLVVLGFLLRGIFSGDDPDTDAPVTTDEVPAVTEAPALESTVAPVETTAAPTLVEAAAGSPYEGNCFAAVVPPGWELVNNDEEVGYGMRTTWRRGGDLLFVDSSPISDPNVTSRDAAAGQLAQRSTATSELIDEGNDAWGYTYTRSGAPAIAIYKVTSRGFGVVGASQNNADQTIADARALIMSIEATNPTCDTGLTG